MENEEFTEAVEDTVIEQVEAVEAVADESPPPSVEDIAANMGWSPKDQWRGDPAKWKPAHEFVAATADINARVTTKLKALEDQLSNVNRTNAVIMEQALAEQRQKLLQERQDAFDIGDAEKFAEAERRLGQMPQVAATPPAEVQTFVEKHSGWFNKDAEATAWAVNRAGELAKQGLGAARQVAIVERELAQYFPEYAPQQEKPKPKAAPLSQPGTRGNTMRGKSFNDLPKEAQEAALYFETKGVSREQYVKSYFEGQAA